MQLHRLGNWPICRNFWPRSGPMLSPKLLVREEPPTRPPVFQPPP